MLRITGGIVYDPANQINGVVKDICIADGRIVAQVEGGRTIDATGMVIFPGGVDIHTHVAGAALNFARAMTPENHRQAAKFLHTPERRMGIGGPTPTTFATGYLYAGMGYTTVVEAAVPVLSAKHTHEELRDTPIVDKACCVLMANNEIVMDLLEAGDFERGGERRRRDGVEMGQGRQADARAGLRLQQDHPRRHPFEPGPDDRRDGPAAPLARALQQSGRARQRGHDAGDDEGARRQSGTHGPSAIPRLRRRRLAHHALRGDADC